MLIGYARVSTQDQNLQLQLALAPSTAFECGSGRPEIVGMLASRGVRLQGAARAIARGSRPVMETSRYVIE